MTDARCHRAVAATPTAAVHERRELDVLDETPPADGDEWEVAAGEHPIDGALADAEALRDLGERHERREDDGPLAGVVSLHDAVSAAAAKRPGTNLADAVATIGVVSQWPAVVGSLGGVALGGGITYLMDHARARRDEETRFRDDERRIFAAFLHAADTFRRVAVRTAEHAYEMHRETGAWITAADLSDARDASNALGNLLQEIELLAVPEVRQAASEISRVTGVLFSMQLAAAHDETTDVIARLHDMRLEYEAALEAFRRAARVQLGRSTR